MRKMEAFGWEFILLLGMCCMEKGNGFSKEKAADKIQNQKLRNMLLHPELHNPVHERESCLVMSDSVTPWIIQSMEFSRQNTGVGSLSLLQGIFEPRSPTLQADSLPDEPLGKPKNTGVGSLFLLQGNLPDPLIDTWTPALQVDSYNL